MNDKQRLQLQNMIKTNNVEDQTELIRNLKHSHILRSEINTLVLLKAKYRDNLEELNNEAMQECNFMFTYYTEIYNKIKKDEIDLGILFKFIDVLRQIEDCEVDHILPYSKGGKTTIENAQIVLRYFNRAKKDNMDYQI